MPRDAVSRTAHVGTQLRKCNGGHKWVNTLLSAHLVAEALLPRAQLTEVLGCLGNDVIAQLKQKKINLRHPAAETTTINLRHPAAETMEINYVK